jgi:uncharacterized protein
MKLLINTITFYQKFISPLLHQALGIQKGFCRFDVRCSEYAKQQILKKGIVAGTFLSVQRLLKCQPFYKVSI